MTTLNLSIDYFGHPDTKALMRLLGKGSEVLPIKLWAYTAHYFSDTGRLTGISTAELEGEVGWWGEAGLMVKQMMVTKFLLDDRGTLCVNNWLEDQGHIAAFKVRAKKGAKARWDKARGEKTDTTSNASSNASSNAPTDLLADPSLHNQPDSCTEPPAASVPVPGLSPFPTVGEVKTWTFTEMDLCFFRESFPHLDVMQHVREAHGWTVANPPKRKTAKGMLRFLHNWLAKEQDRGRGISASVPPSRRDKRAEFDKAIEEFKVTS